METAMISSARASFATTCFAAISFAAPSIAVAQDFDCRAAAPGAESTICASAELRRLDDRMAEIYGLLWGALDDQAFGVSARLDLRDQQRDFLENRQVCGQDSRCMRRLYESRITVLTRTLRIAAHERGQ